VQTPHLSFDGNAVSWQNLPLLNATVIYDDDEIFPSQAEINFLSITVESIYNLPMFFVEDMDYKAGTIIYVDNEVICFQIIIIILAKDDRKIQS